MTNASSVKMSVEDMIGHYQRSIEKSQSDPKRILHCIGKLHRMNVTVHHLQTTGIGRTVNILRKDDGEVGKAAKALISKWKEMVANETSEGSEEEKAQDGYGCEDDDDDDETNKLQIDSISNNDRKTHKTHEHMSKSNSNSSSNSNHHHHREHQHHHHHRDQNEHRSPGKVIENHTHQRKYSSDDTQEHTVHSKHKHKSHSHNDGSSSSSRKREHEHESNGAIVEQDRHKSSSKHSKEDRHHRSRPETQNDGDEISDKKHKNSSREHSKHSDHHKHHSSSTSTSEKTHSSSKHKRSREEDHTSSSPKKHKSDATSSSSRSDKEKSSKTKFKHVDDGIEIDQSMGTSFADALGMLTVPMPSKASTSASTSTASSSGKTSSKTVSPSSSQIKSKVKDKEKEKSKTSTSSTITPSLLLKKPKLPPLEDVLPPVECIIPNDYKPSPVNHMIMDCLYKGSKSQPLNMLNETDALCASTTSKNQRTKVYSGVKSGVLQQVPSLHELCLRFLQKNIDALEYTGGVPFEILKPVIERATPEQLSSFEHFNPYLMDDSDVLWQQHCQRKFKARKRLEMETWREMYYRCLSEQEALLNRLTKNIKESQSVALPVRQTKLAYVDSMVKPPRSVIKKQNQFGTHTKLIATPAARVDALSSVATNIARIGDTRLKTLASIRDTAQAQPSSNGAFKPKKAPLMAKTLQLMKGRFKR